MRAYQLGRVVGRRVLRAGDVSLHRSQSIIARMPLTTNFIRHQSTSNGDKNSAPWTPHPLTSSPTPLDDPLSTLKLTAEPTKHRAYIALGSNLGDRIGWIEQACNEMTARGIKVKRTSSLWETAPMYVLNQEEFVNGACEVETSLDPISLLDELQSIENYLGREKIVDKGPRNIDLDILLYDDHVIEHERLKVPHPAMFEREFVLRPLAELIPGEPLHPAAPWKVTQDYLNALPPSAFPISTMTPLATDMVPLRALQRNRQTLVMAILNVTPDSFSDGGVNFRTSRSNRFSISSGNVKGAKDTQSPHKTYGARGSRSLNDSPEKETRYSRFSNKSYASRDNSSYNSTDARGVQSSRFSYNSKDNQSNTGNQFYSDSAPSNTDSSSPNLTTMYQHLSPLFHSGASIIDVGGQSTAPGRPEVTAEEELSRILPPIMLAAEERLQSNLKFAISIDTYRASVAEAAVNAGADIINDISAGVLDPDMLPTVARLGKTICLMHMRGTPKTMKDFTDYPNGLIPTIANELLARVAAAEAVGIRRWRIVLDPGIGFAKTIDQNLEILRRLDDLREWPGLVGLPWLLGSSRKRFVGEVTGVSRPAMRDWGTAATVVAAVKGGADIVRVHEVGGMQQVVRMSDAIWRV